MDCNSFYQTLAAHALAGLSLGTPHIYTHHMGRVFHSQNTGIYCVVITLHNWECGIPPHGCTLLMALIMMLVVLELFWYVV